MKTSISEIKLIKLVNGENLIGKVELEDEDTVEIKEVLEYHSVTTERGPIITCSDWIPFCNVDEQFVIPRRHIIVMAPINEVLENIYSNFLDEIVTGNDEYLESLRSANAEKKKNYN